MHVDSHIVKAPYIESPHAPKNVPLFTSHKDPYSRINPYYSYPVIDMTKAHKIGTPQFHKIRVQSSQKEELKFEVSQKFNVCINNIHIIEKGGRKEEVLLKTIIVILPDSVGEDYCSLLVELFESMIQMHPKLICVRLPVRQTIKDLKKLLTEELNWKGLALCQNGNVLEDDLNLKSCNFSCLSRIQAMRQSCHKIDFVYQPRSDISCSYWLEVDMNSSILEVKRKFEEHFHDEIEKQKHSKESTIHFCFQDRLLEDKECVGLVLQKNIKEENISIHFGSKNAISIDLKFKVGRKTKHKLLIVSRKISTTSLRTEASKHLGVDPKAVKLTFNDKLLDEHDDLSRVYKERWQSGCRIAAGIKKCKTLRIKHPTECDEKPFNMYMLDPVSVLKRKVSEAWGLNLLQISLFCRDMQMEYDQPLQYYPIKNNMEISLRLYQHRIILKVVVLFGKRRISLVIDNSKATTVDDLLRFCAHLYGYPRERSRGIYKDKCLDRTCKLADHGIKSGDTIIISYFDQPNLLQGDLINIYMGDENGHMSKRLGTVSSGLLLHAPKTVEAPQIPDTCLDNGHLPEGIRICETKEGVTSLPGQMLKSNLKKGISGGKNHTATIDMKNKANFLNRARRLIQQKYSETHGRPEKFAKGRPAFYLGEEWTEEFELDEETGRKTVVSYKDTVSTDGKENSNTEVKSKFNEQKSQIQAMLKNIGGTNKDEKSEIGAISERVAISERDEKSERDVNFERVVNFEKDEKSEEKSELGNQSVRDEQHVRGEIESDGPTSEDNVICQRVKCIENCCKKIREVQSEKALDELQSLNEIKNQACPRNLNETKHFDQFSLNGEKEKSKDIDFVLEGNPNHYLKLKFDALDKYTTFKNSRRENSFDHPNDLSGCDTETSGCESSHNNPTKLNIVPQRGHRAYDTDSSDIDHVTSSHGEDCLCNRKCLTGEKFTRCPFIQCQIGIHGKKQRVHTLSESSAYVFDLRPTHQAQGGLHLNRTYPSFEEIFLHPNSDIETSGISLPLLIYVGRSLGNKWKALLRTLSVGETELDEIEYKYRNDGLTELGYRALITWKQSMGSKATKEDLLKALETVGLKSVAEKSVNVGYCTA